jgi:nicotinamidase-related amidase
MKDRGNVARVGWVVDVQKDFMEPNGRLYVHNLFDPTDPGAKEAAPAIEKAVRWMRQNCDVLVFTGDWHAYGDREIDPVAPDPAKETYPPHCMGLSPDPAEREGAALVEWVTRGEPLLVLPRDATPEQAEEIARRAVEERRPVFVQKNEFSVFKGNTGADAFVRALRERLGDRVEFVVCGVATDVCVRHAVEGMLDRGLAVRVIRDATWGLGLLGPEATFDAWARRGAQLTSVAELPEPAVSGSPNRLAGSA